MKMPLPKNCAAHYERSEEPSGGQARPKEQEGLSAAA